MKLKLTELTKNTIAYLAISAATTELALILINRTTQYTIPTTWHTTAPLIPWLIAGIPTTIALATRLTQTITQHPTITTHPDHSPHHIRAIPFGKTHILAHNTPTLLNHNSPPTPTRPTAWTITLPGHTPITIHEHELTQFLQTAHKRHKHQFSRRYWTRTRRPPLWRPKYEAYMHLLTTARLIEGRTGGASGRLVTHPRHALTYLKHESPHRTHWGTQ